MNVAVVSGRPDDVELAALLAGLTAGWAGFPNPAAPTTGPGHTGAAQAAGAADAAAVAKARWRRAARPDHVPTSPGPDAWRWSLR